MFPTTRLVTRSQQTRPPLRKECATVPASARGYFMNRSTSLIVVGAAALLMLIGCNSGTNTSSAPGTSTPQRGQLLTNPPVLVATFSTSDLLGLLTQDTIGKELLTLAYSP